MPVINQPCSRFHLTIPRKAAVLEVGSGHNPHPAAGTIVDKYLNSNYHRSDDAKKLNHQEFIEADGQHLPFRKHAFDYIICCQVLEHVDDPAAFLEEHFRMAPMGYIETPSLIGEVLFARQSHRWLLQYIDDVLYIVDKNLVNFEVRYNLMELVQDYLPAHSVGFKILERTHPNLLTVRLQWKERFSYVINPTDPDILKYFSGQWQYNWNSKFFPEKTMNKEFRDAMVALAGIAKSVLKTKFKTRRLAKKI